MWPVINSATAAGTKVSDKTKADSKAMMTVMAIGVNILPSTPLKAKIGRFTKITTSTLIKLGVNTSRVAVNTVLKRSSSFKMRPSSCCRPAKRRMQFSTIITAPSTIKPKSRAPRLIRLALTFACTMPVISINIDSGMTIAVINAARILPSISNNTTTTNTAPSARLACTVAMVLSTSTVRSYTGSAITPSGRVLLISFSLADTAWETVRLLPPSSITAVPNTVSLPSRVAAPVRNSLPKPTSATSATVIGIPPRRARIMRLISAMSATCPGARIRYCSPFFSI